jgi:hypothetical protein
MAYLRDLPKPRCRCGKPPAVELVNRRNAPCGTYCRNCAKRALARLVERERLEADR